MMLKLRMLRVFWLRCPMLLCLWDTFVMFRQSAFLGRYFHVLQLSSFGGMFAVADEMVFRLHSKLHRSWGFCNQQREIPSLNLHSPWQTIVGRLRLVGPFWECFVSGAMLNFSGVGQFATNRFFPGMSCLLCRESYRGSSIKEETGTRVGVCTWGGAECNAYLTLLLHNHRMSCGSSCCLVGDATGLGCSPWCLRRAALDTTQYVAATSSTLTLC